MADRDQSGNLARRARIYRGPSLGWAVVDVEPERFASTSPISIGSGDSIILLTGATMVINLPDVSQWILDSVDNPNFRAPFDRGIEIIDFGGLATDAQRHQINPFGNQLIMGQTHWFIISAYTGVLLRPLFDLSGWYAR